jgi:Methyltransferase domain
MIRASVFHYWDSALLPLLEARLPKTVIEVGAWEGAHTRLLATWAAEHDAMVHVIDPMPQFDADAFTKEWAGHLEVHRDLSLNALTPIGPVDMILLDGDHNWYTVFNELQQIDRINADWPVLAMHDVGWPYGRRDMYYAPETIPSEYLQPHRRSGMLQYCSALTEQGRIGHNWNAEREGGARNGVLTALEDFFAQTHRDLRLFARPGRGGLGVVVSAEALQDEKLASTLASIHDPRYAVTVSPVYATREFGEARVGTVPAQHPRPAGLLRFLRRARTRVRRRLGPVGRA